MNFASLMKSQISAGGKATETTGPKKYLRRSEIEAQRQAEYIREQAELERVRVERLEKKRKREEEDAERDAAREAKKHRLAEQSRLIREEEEEREEAVRRKRLGLPELVKQKSEDNGIAATEGEEDIAEDELREKLRQLGEPRVLFGEAHAQRLRRYRKLTRPTTIAPKMSEGPIPTTLELLPEKDMEVPSAIPANRSYLHRQLASYFTLLLGEWQRALARRAPEVIASYTGKQASNSYLAARDNLRPLFRKLETSTLQDTILAPIVEIVHLAQRKRYVDANDAYLRCSIGKAAWPIGVTMVGIHERSAREKLHEHGEKEQAHILSDEVTRKMLQGIKRCLSYAQTRWPPEDVGQLMG